MGYVLWKSLTRDYPSDDFIPTLRRLLSDLSRLVYALGKLLWRLPVRLVVDLMALFTRRVAVSDRSMSHMVAYLKSELRDTKGFKQVDQIPDSVWLSIVHEALNRAAEKEKDGRARSGEFINQVDAAVDNVVAAFEGTGGSDSRIKNILIFNRVL